MLTGAENTTVTVKFDSGTSVQLKRQRVLSTGMSDQISGVGLVLEGMQDVRIYCYIFCYVMYRYLKFSHPIFRVRTVGRHSAQSAKANQSRGNYSRQPCPQ